jgi:glutamyl-tRNA reductase
MNVQVAYCSHQTTPLALRERLAFASLEQLTRAYETLRATFPKSEHVVLSTCNRVEIYAAQDESNPPLTQEQVAEFLSRFHGVSQNDLGGALLWQKGPEAVRHLFEVASSLDSMVLGEPQIVSQVKEAYRVAQENDACGPLTHALFQGAMRVSGRVRSETALAVGRVSVASVAVGEFGKSIFDRFADKTVVVIGAGEMAEETLRYLKDEGAQGIIVVNRSLERAQRLAAQFGGTARPFDELDAWLAHADVIVSTTGAAEPIVDVKRFQAARAVSDGKPVFILDLATPRDFAPAVADIDENVFLYDIEALQATCDQNRRQRAREIERARRIVEEETERFLHDIYHKATGPIISQLRAGWRKVCQDELDQLFSKYDRLDAEERRGIERTVERIVNKLLHPPLEALRDEARKGTPHGLLEALKRLFFTGQ